jgi:putative ABC transport system ATP-binding protein
VLLEIKKIKKTYTRGRAFAAVDGVDLSVAEGDFVTIVGKSGSGKSTLMNMTVGLLRPDGGNIFFEGTDLFSLTDDEMSSIRNRNIGYVPQGCGLLNNLSVIDNIRLPAFFFESPTDSVPRARRLLERVGLKGFGNHSPSTLSGGESRRVAIARALMCGPKVIVADEPTGDLDHETTQEIMELFSELNKAGTAVIMVTHDQDSAGYGDRLMVMEKGKLREAKRGDLSREV